MKKIYLIFACCFLTAINSFSQVSINTDGSQPDPAAILDVKSINSGFLFPRMTQEQRNAISSPATGLFIYNTTSNLFNYFNGSFWAQIEAGFISFSTGWAHPGVGVSINTTVAVPPDSSAMVDVTSTTKGVLIPRTTPGSITSPPAGLIIYNTSTNLLNYFNGTGWIALCGTSTGVPGGPTGAQEVAGVAFNAGNTPPHPSAVLDIYANKKGMLIPRLPYYMRNQIRPVRGLTIYNTSSNAIEYYSGTGWYQLNNCPCSACGQPFSDFHNGKIYTTVQIGTQCWMAENLNTGTMINSSGNQTNNNIIEKYCYGDLESNCDVYGGLYQWAEMVQYHNGATNTTSWSPAPSGNVQGICPPGWHLPTDGEWATLTAFLGGDTVAGGKMKEEGTAHWASPNTGATNSSGFTGLPGGSRMYYGGFYNVTGMTGFWSATESSGYRGGTKYLHYFKPEEYLYNTAKINGFSVRCIMDALHSDFSANITYTCTNSSVIFVDLSTGSPTSKSWNFPGGTPASYNGQIPPPVYYSLPGTYDVSLTISDGTNTDTETKTGFITVNYMTADFTGTPTTVMSGGFVTYTNNSCSCNEATWNWSFPGGNPSSYNGQNPPEIQYGTLGNFDVSLIVTRPGETDTMTRTGYIVVEYDGDGDGIPDFMDNCPWNWNPGQEDCDGDGIGDACDYESLCGCAYWRDCDCDGHDDPSDNCPYIWNPGQEDCNNNRVGDVCDSNGDTDGDGHCDNVDNCPNNWNPGQEDSNMNGIGDICDPCIPEDADCDGIPDSLDNCPSWGMNWNGGWNPGQEDCNNNGIGDICDGADDDCDGIYNSVDNCIWTWNPGQEDCNNNGVGDVCDPCACECCESCPTDDLDCDGIFNWDDNCPLICNPYQYDCNGNGIGDACDPCLCNDMDCDGIYDWMDNCPSTWNPGQEDCNGNGIGDVCDPEPCP